MEITVQVIPFSEVPNYNNRIYDYDCISDIVIEEYKQHINNKTALGEFFVYWDCEDLSVINLKNVSHTITDIFKKPDGLYAVIKTTKSPLGLKLEKISNKVVFRLRHNCVLRYMGINKIAIRVEKILSIDAISSFNDSFSKYSYKNHRISFKKQTDSSNIGKG